MFTSQCIAKRYLSDLGDAPEPAADVERQLVKSVVRHRHDVAMCTHPADDHGQIAGVVLSRGHIEGRL